MIPWLVVVNKHRLTHDQKAVVSPRIMLLFLFTLSRFSLDLASFQAEVQLVLCLWWTDV